MIFIALFVIIAIVVIGLNLHDTSNLEKIQEHLKTNNCKEYVYSKGSYKALCEDRVLEVHNSFFVDLQKNSKDFDYKSINSLEIKKKNIIINGNDKLEFKLE
jgi:hypothetical protein